MIYSRPSNPAEQISHRSVKRDSTASIKNWQNRLSTDEIARIREGTAEVADDYYGSDDWI